MPACVLWLCLARLACSTSCCCVLWLVWSSCVLLQALCVQVAAVLALAAACVRVRACTLALPTRANLIGLGHC